MPIFDQGYQHWQGPLTPFRWRWWAIARHGVRATLKSKVVRGMMLLAWMPAIILVIVLALWGLLEQKSESIMALVGQMLPPEMLGKPTEFRSAVWTIVYAFFFKAQLSWMVFIVLAVGPSLISGDLRFNALPLYFSRPIRRIDYFIGKLGVIGFFVAATTIGPALIAYLFGIAFSLDLSVIRDTHRLLWASVIYGSIVTVSAGTLMLALSSLSRRSIYVGIAWAGFCFLTWSISSLLIVIQAQTQQRVVVETQMQKWLANHPPPEGVIMRGEFPVWHTRGETESRSAEQQAKIDRWHSDWSEAYSNAYSSSRRGKNQAAIAKSDWRAIVGYTNNLDRIGDALLDADGAWLSIGKAINKQRTGMIPAIARHAGSRVSKDLMNSDERVLADTLVWQFPWQWSAGVLAGLWLLSVLILSTRVKSLDRLK